MTRSEAGFTLIEMVAVMSMIALLALLALPAANRGTSRAGVEQLARRAASLLKADRYAAIRRRATIATRVDMRRREIWSGSGQAVLRIPTDVDMRADVGAACGVTRDEVSVSFQPDGRACGGTLTIGRESAVFEVRVNWLTGGVEIVATPYS